MIGSNSLASLLLALIVLPGTACLDAEIGGTQGLQIGTFAGLGGTFQAPYVVEGDYAVVGGDMLYPLEDVQDTDGQIAATGSRNGGHLWTNGIIPYVDGTNNPYFGQAVAAWNQVSNRTGVQLIPRTNEVNYIDASSPAGQCASDVGMNGGAQSLYIDASCGSDAIHEIGHAIGLIHEHQRSDRDSTITIDWGNLIGGEYSEDAQLNVAIHQGNIEITTAMDLDSVMLYPNFSNNGSRFLDPTRPWYTVNGDETRVINNTTMSELDIGAIGFIYAQIIGENEPEEELPPEEELLPEEELPPEEEPLPNEELPKSSFDCGGGALVPWASVCDLYKDCQNGADEEGCAKP